MSYLNTKRNTGNIANQKQITIRRAEKGDIDALNRICRQCFPDNTRWQVGFLAEKFWNGALELPSSETWIWLANDEAAGFSHIIVDLGAWAKEKRDLGFGRAARLFALATRPRLFLQKIQKRIRLALYERKGETQTGGSEMSMMGRAFECFNQNSLKSPLIHYGGIYADPSKIIWVERAAVLPHYRKLGLALQIMRFSEERAKKLGRSAICGVIEAVNEPWRWMHERFGYVITHTKSGRYTYTKILGGEERQG